MQISLSVCAGCHGSEAQASNDKGSTPRPTTASASTPSQSCSTVAYEPAEVGRGHQVAVVVQLQ